MFATTQQLEATAELIARVAHAGQVDKAGEPYINHPARVVARLSEDAHHDRAAAWLHDVVEDTDVTLDQLRTVVSPTVVSAIDALTHREGEARADYYQRILKSQTALRVKAADIADNTDPARMARLDPDTRDRLIAKYDKARKILGIAA